MLPVLGWGDDNAEETRRGVDGKYPNCLRSRQEECRCLCLLGNADELVV